MIPEIPKALLTGTAAGWSLVVLAIAGLATQWIKTRADRRRADAEGRVSDEAANDAQWGRFQKEIVRLVGRIETLEDRVRELEAEVDQCRREKGDALSELIRLRAVNHGQAEGRQEAARIVAIERLANRGEMK